tara:strand:+ start:1106 stop:1363 length:258 start_codon:yes stop_codon:yes gene_type:complete
MADGNPLANVPPWVYLVVLLGGGGTLSGLQMGGGQSPVVAQPPQLETCQDAEQRAIDALAAWRGMITSYGLILEQLNQCHQGNEG